MSRSGFTSVARAVAWRNIHNFFTNPLFVIPGLMFPLFFFTAFAGGLSRVDSVPGFDYGASRADWRYDGDDYHSAVAAAPDSDLRLRITSEQGRVSPADLDRAADLKARATSAR